MRLSHLTEVSHLYLQCNVEREGIYNGREQLLIRVDSCAMCSLSPFLGRDVGGLLLPGAFLLDVVHGILHKIHGKARRPLGPVNAIRAHPSAIDPVLVIMIRSRLLLAFVHAKHVQIQRPT